MYPIFLLIQFSARNVLQTLSIMVSLLSTVGDDGGAVDAHAQYVVGARSAKGGREKESLSSPPLLVLILAPAKQAKVAIINAT